MGSTELDPITFEILRHRLEEIIGEMFYTIARVSGNPVIFEVSDHEEGILDANGEAVLIGGGIVEWVYSLEAGGKHLVKEYQENPGIYDGDQFIMNHAYVAAVHTPDVQILAPIFWEGKRVAWVVTAGHQTDVGGIDPGTLSLRAEEVYQEGLQIPGLKIVEGGRIRKDVEATIRAMVRTPDLCMLDISSKIASNNVAKARLLEMIGRYGLDTVLALFEQIKGYSEQLVRAKLRKIPDGRYTAVHYTESVRRDVEPYIKVEVTITKEGDSLTMDFTGSSPQSPTSHNVSKIGAISNALDSYLTLLCYDIPWSSGVWRPVKFILPEGTCVNPRWPAATSTNTPSGAAYMVVGAVHEATSKMCLATEELRNEAFADTGATGHGLFLSGINKDGTYFVHIIMDLICGGMGALANMDGVDSCGNMETPKTQITNLEVSELLLPILYLARREVPDTGGAGKFRGGVTILSCFTPWDAPRKEIQVVDYGWGVEPRTGSGLAGGYPCPNTQAGIIRNSGIFERFKGGEFPTAPKDLGGDLEILPPLPSFKLHEGEVVFCYHGGGGGYGDPLERDPALVLKDVKLGYVSLDAARDVYGVVIDPKKVEVDPRKTAEQRRKMIEERLSVGAK